MIRNAEHLLREGEKLGSTDLLDRAIALYEKATPLLRDWELLPLLHSNHGGAYLRRWEIEQRPEDLYRGVELTKLALRSQPDDEYRTKIAGQLAGAMEMQRRVGADPFVARARGTLEEARKSDLSNEIGQRKVIVAAGAAIAAYDGPRDFAFVEPIIPLAREAYAKATGQLRWELGTQLATILRKKFEVGNDRRDLDESLAHAREASTNITEIGPAWFDAKTSLAHALGALETETGDRSAFDESIAVQEEIVARSTTIDPFLRAGALHNLANDLAERFKRDGDVADLDREIELRRDALSAIPTDSDLRPSFLGSCANAVLTRYQFQGDNRALNEAIHLFDEARAWAEQDPRGSARHENSLGTSLKYRFEQTGDAKDLDLAIEAFRRAIEREEIPEARATYRSNLGAALRNRGMERRSEQDLVEAIAVHRDAVSAAPRGSRARSSFESNLANALESLSAITGDENHANEITALRREVVANARSNPEAALRSAREWGAWASRRGRYEEALEAFDALFELLIDLVARQGERAGREGWIGLSQDAAGLAAFAAAKSGDPRRAVAYLERSQASLLADLLSQDGEAIFQRQELATVLAIVQREIGSRRLVYLSSTELGSLILVVSSKDIEPTFTDLDMDALRDFLFRIDSGKVVGGFLAGQLSRSSWLRESLGSPFDKVSAQLLGSVATRLRTNVDELVLIPCGVLALLPLHAAPMGEGTVLLDHFEVTFAPNARFWARAMDQSRDRRRARVELVGVANAEPIDAPLRASQVEAERIAQLFTTSELYLGLEATKKEILSRLADGRFFHFAVHGQFDSISPLKSSLRLTDGPLTAGEVLALRGRLGAAELVVLSACQSGIVEAGRLRDESTGLVSSWLAAGAPRVIGSLWKVSDVWTAILMTRTYELMMKDGLRPPAALRRAQIWLRDASSEELAPLMEDFERSIGFDATRLGGGDEGGQTGPYQWAAFYFAGASSSFWTGDQLNGERALPSGSAGSHFSVS